MNKKVNLVDPFTVQLDKIQKTQKQILSDLQERDNAAVTGKPTGKLEATLRAYLKDIKEQFKNLEQHLEESRYVNPEEYSKKKEIYTQTEKHINELEQRQKSPPQYNEEKQKRDLLRDSQQYNQLSNEELVKANKNMLQQQDEQIDMLIGTVGNIKRAGLETRDELNLQDKLLDDLESNVDQNITQMEKVSNKLKKILQTSSNWTIIGIVLAEIAIIILLCVF